jgi:hypothetical protein
MPVDHYTRQPYGIFTRWSFGGCGTGYVAGYVFGRPEIRTSGWIGNQRQSVRSVAEGCWVYGKVMPHTLGGVRMFGKLKSQTGREKKVYTLVGLQLQLSSNRTSWLDFRRIVGATIIKVMHSMKKYFIISLLSFTYI